MGLEPPHATPFKGDFYEYYDSNNRKLDFGVINNPRQYGEVLGWFVAALRYHPEEVLVNVEPYIDVVRRLRSKPLYYQLAKVVGVNWVIRIRPTIEVDAAKLDNRGRHELRVQLMKYNQFVHALL